MNKYSFEDCTKLTSINIPDGVTDIDENAFGDCTNLTSINIPDSVTSIGDYAFKGCTSLTSINIPDSVISIGNYAFADCISLTSVNLPDSVKSLGNCVFGGCVGLTTITVDNNNKKYASVDGVLYNKSKSKLVIYPEGKKGEYTIPNGVKSIGPSAFIGCTSLTSINIPNSVTNIYSFAFVGCTSLTNINIPESVTNIGKGAFGSFGNNAGLTTITVDKNNKNYTSVDDVLYDKNKSELVIYPKCKSGEYTIPNSVTSIGESAFEDCTKLTNINIPDSVRSIGDFAFCGCTNLASISIPDSVTDIGEYAFLRCENLVIRAIKNSAAYKYAVKKHIEVDEFIKDCKTKDGMIVNIKEKALIPFDDGLTKIASFISISYKNDVIKQLIEQYNYKCSVCAADSIDCYIDKDVDHMSDNRCEEFPYYGVKTINDLTKTIISFLINNGTYDDGFAEAIIDKFDSIIVSYENIDGNVVTSMSWKTYVYKGYIFGIKNDRFTCKFETCTSGW